MPPLLLLLYRKESDMMMKMLCECVAFDISFQWIKNKSSGFIYIFAYSSKSLYKKIRGKSARANAFFPLTPPSSFLFMLPSHLCVYSQNYMYKRKSSQQGHFPLDYAFRHHHRHQRREGRALWVLFVFLVFFYLDLTCCIELYCTYSFGFVAFCR